MIVKLVYLNLCLFERHTTQHHVFPWRLPGWCTSCQSNIYIPSFLKIMLNCL